jgi:SpoIID/LytB domain protein
VPSARGLLAAAVGLAGSVGLAAAAPAAAAAGAPPSSVTLEVHGYGHGMGMGQYGALGYALEDGWSYQQILQHYYGTLVDGGSTTLSTLPAASVGSTGLSSDQAPITVEITANQGSDIIVASEAAFSVSGGGLSTPLPVPAGGAAMFQLSTTGASPGTWTVSVNDGGGPGACAGGASGWGSPVATGVTDPTATPANPAAFPASGNLDAQTLELCENGRYYRGSLGGAVSATDPTLAVTLNTLPLGQYVADSAAAESPGSWGSLGSAGPQGQPQGFQQTEAQVVATRSYAVADAVGGRYGGVADICDSTACQAYPGVADENAYDDLAVADTANQVVLLPGGAVALTQYSASTGGYTQPGSGSTGFAAVPDTGDAICTSQVCNPYHAYTATVPAATIDLAYPQIGTFESLQVTARNGLGDFGGRVEAVEVVGTSGSVTVTGNDFAAAVAGSVTDQLDMPGGTFAASGVISNWFAVEGQPAGGTTGYWQLGSDGGIFSFGSAQFYGSMGGTPLNEPIVAMAPTPDGHGYWLLAADGGVFAFGDAQFYGSLPGSDVSATAVAILPSADGQGYLIETSSGRLLPYGDAPQLGDVTTAVPGFAGRIIGGATVP